MSAEHTITIDLIQAIIFYLISLVVAGAIQFAA